MHAYKQQVTVPSDHGLAIRLPDDFPPGPAEVIVLAMASAPEPSQCRVKRLEPHPVLGRIIFHEDPSLPLDSEDWPETMR